MLLIKDFIKHGLLGLLALCCFCVTFYQATADVLEDGENFYAFGLVVGITNCTAVECDYEIRMKHGNEVWRAGAGFNAGRLLYRKWNSIHGYNYGDNSLITPAPISGANWVTRAVLPEYSGAAK